MANIAQSDIEYIESKEHEDRQQLKQRLSRALRRQKFRAFGLVLPLLIFVLMSFALPIGDMLFRSVENDIVAETLPKTVQALANWDPKLQKVPSEDVFDALAADLKTAVSNKTHTQLGSRLNYEHTGMSSLFRKTGRPVKKWNIEAEAPFKAKLIDVDKRWGEIETWQTIAAFSSRFTDGYFLNAVDLKRGADGIRQLDEDERIYGILFTRTFVMSGAIMLMCLLLGYPVAFLLANLGAKHSNILMIFVLLPFWTSLLVRTSAWKILLQQQGVINDILVWIGLIGDSERLILMNNQTGTIIAMTHILLPFMILPLYSVMKTISPTYVRAAKSLGANDWTAFWRVYFPQSAPGIGAGGILVFIMSIGYYITPELVGGTTGTFISNRIAFHISSSLNWGLAAALGAILLLAVLILYAAYDKLVGIRNVSLG